MVSSNNPFVNYSQNLQPAASSFENPSPANCFLNFPASLLDDEELLLDHFLRHSQPLTLHTATTTTTTTATTATSIAPKEDGVSSHDPMDQHDHQSTNPTTNTSNSAENTRLPSDDEATLQPPKLQLPPPPPPPEAAGKRKRGGGRTKQPRAGPPRRRAGKKDRHSKIHTTQGPRDRRMRLSLQIARKFFDLQDMLGYDKASKTIEWLFSNSKTAIKELTASLPPQRSCTTLSSATTNSDCIISSSTLITDKGEDSNNRITMGEDGDGEGDAVGKLGAKSTGNKSTIVGSASSLARESREKTRARARLRTMEKKKQKELASSLEINPNDDHDDKNNDNCKLVMFGSSKTPETTGTDHQEESGGAHSHSHYNYHGRVENFTSLLNQHSSLEHQMASVKIMEKLLGGGSSSASSSSIYDDYGYMGFPGNWATDNTRFNSNYGAISSVGNDPMLLLQQQNPNSVFMEATNSSGLYLQSQYFESHFSGSSPDPGLL